VIAPVIKGLELGRRLGLARAGCIVGIAVTAVRRIGENELRDVQSGGSCAQRERRTGGVTVDQCRLAGLGDERGHIVEFTLDRVRLGVTALPAATPVVGVDREMLRQLARQREIEAVISQSAIDDDQRRALARLLPAAEARDDLRHATGQGPGRHHAGAGPARHDPHRPGSRVWAIILAGAVANDGIPRGR
jgi:hypothetical protein